MSSIPNSAMPHAKAAPKPATRPQGSDQGSALDRTLAKVRSVPNGAWLAGAAAIGAAGLAAVASGLRGTAGKKERGGRRAARRKSGRS